MCHPTQRTCFTPPGNDSGCLTYTNKSRFCRECHLAPTPAPQPGTYYTQPVSDDGVWFGIMLFAMLLLYALAACL